MSDTPSSRSGLIVLLMMAVLALLFLGGLQIAKYRRLGFFPFSSSGKSP